MPREKQYYYDTWLDDVMMSHRQTCHYHCKFYVDKTLWKRQQSLPPLHV